MSKHRHFILHKPYGFLSQFIYNGKRRKNKGLLGDLYEFPMGTMAIGRLDEDSEGLIFLTTDGKVSHEVRGKHVEKEYYVQVDGLITDEAIQLLKSGIQIGVEGKKYTTLPCNAYKLIPKPLFPNRIKKIRDDRHGPTSWVSITIKEGKNRQVRKMTAAAGFPTLRLFRVRIGNVVLGDLEAGNVIEVNQFDI